jgi:hypothetical protein
LIIGSKLLSKRTTRSGRTLTHFSKENKAKSKAKNKEKPPKRQPKNE